MAKLTAKAEGKAEDKNRVAQHQAAEFEALRMGNSGNGAGRLCLCTYFTFDFFLYTLISINNMIKYSVL